MCVLALPLRCSVPQNHDLKIYVLFYFHFISYDLGCEAKCDSFRHGSTGICDVPGTKVMLEEEPNVPLSVVWTKQTTFADTVHGAVTRNMLHINALHYSL